MVLRREVIDLGNQVSSDIAHGEVFYEPAHLLDFIKTLEKLKDKAIKLYQHNEENEMNTSIDNKVWGVYLYGSLMVSYETEAQAKAASDIASMETGLVHTVSRVPGRGGNK